MSVEYSFQYPSVEDLRVAAQGRIPKFAFEYLDGGCNEDVNLKKNTDDIRKIELVPQYLSRYHTPDLSKEIFGVKFNAPFGISPIGLQGLIWPGAPEILAKTAKKYNIPFILSTVTTMSIERAAELTEGKFWFQLYHPAEDSLRDRILNRVEASGCDVLVLLSDVPTFGFRPRDIRNGLAMPPKMSVRNMIQIMSRPKWAVNTLIHGKPQFESLTPYMTEKLNLQGLGAFMNKTFDGRLNEDKLAAIRDRWDGKLVLKGVASEEDAEKAIKLGIDGIIVSNHGGRQLDAGQSSIESLKPIVKRYKEKITIMMDSGIRSGPDMARALASGAEFTFLGRTFMYSVAALASKGGDHAYGMLHTQLRQVLEQICCQSISDLPKFKVG